MGDYIKNKDNNAKIRARITETERNVGIARRFRRGQIGEGPKISKAGLARMYQLSETRIGQIIRQYTPLLEQEAQFNG